MAVDFNMKVLVVDDVRTIRRIIINLLSSLGFKNIDEANNGTLALEKVLEGGYGLIISDWNMEEISGLDLLKKIRSLNTEVSKIPFIMVTAENKADNIIEAKKAGVTTYIVKPFNIDILKDRLINILGNF